MTSATDPERTGQPTGAAGPATDPPEQPDLRDAIATAAGRSGLGRVAPGEAPTASALLGAIGGIRGLAESILPGLGFLVVYTLTSDVLPSVLAPLALAAAFVIARLVARQPVTTALAGLLGIAISAAFALISGRAEENFVPGFFINGVTFVLMLASIAARWPAVGLVVGSLTGDVTGWRADRAKRRVAVIATLLWAGLSGLRLAVQLPIYFFAEDPAAALAPTKLLMGVPLYAGLLWVTWLLVRAAWTAPAAQQDAGAPTQQEPRRDV